MNLLRHHIFALQGAVRHLRKAPGSFFLNVLVVALALTLPFTGLTILENMKPVSNQVSVQPEVSIFLKLDATPDQVQDFNNTIKTALKQHQLTGTITYISKDSALQNLKNKTGLDNVLSSLGTNPLPDSFVVTLTNLSDQDPSNTIKQLTNDLQNAPAVDVVQLDSEWIKRLSALLHIMHVALFFLAIALSTVVIAVVFNTIRLQVMTQFDEIEVSRLFGATDSFIHRPFYYTGALLGLLAGVLAFVFVAIALQPLNSAISDFAHLYASEFALSLPDTGTTILLLIASAVLGLIGAKLSVRKHLAKLR